MAWSLQPWLDRFLNKGLGEMNAKQAIVSASQEKLLLSFILRGNAPVAILAFEIVNYPNLKALRVVGMAGREFRQWQALATDYLTLCARSLGAARLEACGRPGLGRLCGAQERARFFTREV